MANIFKAKTLVGRTGLFSHEVIAPNLVYNTGDQTINGNKTFVDNIEIQGTGIFNSVDLSNISEFQFSGVTMNLVDTNVYVSGGWIYISGNPVLTGAQSISTINLDNIVYTTGNQTIEGIKDFNNIINVSGIQFDILTTPQTPAYQEGLLYYSDSTKTLNLYSDVAGLELPIGQENWLRAKNLTNSTITPGTVVYIDGAQGNTPLVQRSIASGDSTSARTVAIAAHSINDNSKGYFTTFGIVENIDTSLFNVGQTLYLSWTESGKFTGVKPQAPYHMVRIGNVIDQGNNGSIFVNIQNGFEIDELHDVRIVNPSNNNGIVYNSASGLWLNTPVLTGDQSLNRDLNELRVNNIVYTTGTQTIAGRKVFNSRIAVHSISGINDALTLDILGANDYSIGFGTVGGGINIQPGTGQIYLSPTPNYGGLQLLGAGPKYLGNISIIGNTNLYTNDVDGTVREFNIYKTGVWFGTPSYFKGLTVSSNSISINNPPVGTDQPGFGLYISGVGVTPASYANINNLFLTGSNLDNKINSLSGNAVLLFGNQTVNGIKTFQSDTYFTNLASGLSGIFGINHSIGTFANNAVILGGNTNRIGNSGFSSIVNGCNNTITGLYSFIGNGREHVITNNSSFIGGGLINKIGCSGVIAQGSLDFIGGGLCNTIGGNRSSVIVGGEANCITSSASCECGSFIGGGLCNTICNSIASNILGGCGNVLCPSLYSSILGGRCNILSFNINDSSILGGFCNNISSSSIALFSNILGGCCNSSSVNPAYSTIVNGICQRMQSYHSFIGVGINNFVSGVGYGVGGYHAFIGNGYFNCASMGGSFDFIGNGSRQKIFGSQSCNNSILNGIDNQIGHPNLSFSSKFSSILNGSFNTISGSPAAYPGSCSSTVLYSTIINGTSNTITSDFSTILGGRFNNITHNGATIISDGSSRTKNSIGNCTLLIDFCCGTSFGNNTLFDVTPQILNVNTNFSIGTGYNSRVVLANSGSMLTGTISLGNPIGFNTSIIQVGAGQVQITGSAGVTINSYNNQFQTAGQYATLSLLHSGNNGYLIYGNTA